VMRRVVAGFDEVEVAIAVDIAHGEVRVPAAPEADASELPRRAPLRATLIDPDFTLPAAVSAVAHVQIAVAIHVSHVGARRIRAAQSLTAIEKLPGSHHGRRKRDLVVFYFAVGRSPPRAQAARRAQTEPGEGRAGNGRGRRIEGDGIVAAVDSDA